VKPPVKINPKLKQGLNFLFMATYPVTGEGGNKG